MAEVIPYPQRSILLVDDEPAWTHSLSLSLKVSAGINHLICCHDSREAMALLERHDCSLVLLDLTMPYLDGETLLKQINEQLPEIPVIIISGMNQIETAVRCVKFGAADFYVKTDDRERVVAGVMRILKQQQLEQQNRDLTHCLLGAKDDQSPAFAAIVTGSDKMRAIFCYLRAICKSDEPILITGESGVGKELVARGLYQLRCPERPWVAVNVAGLDDMVFSDTLFGHVPGAFTGADRARKGMLEEAADGVLFFDEIGDLSSASQVKLLRLLQEGEYFPLGGDQPRKARACILTATNQDLAAKVEQGSFRRDLHYRLCAHQVVVPPLRERREDLPLLVDHFLTEAAASFGKKKPVIPRQLIPLLVSYSFPGNVRELRAMVLDAMSVHDRGSLSLEQFKQTIDTGGEPLLDAGDKRVHFPLVLPTLKEVSQLLIDEALQRAQGNRSAAARMLGVTPQALSKRLK